MMIHPVLAPLGGTGHLASDLPIEVLAVWPWIYVLRCSRGVDPTRACFSI
jgi:hypothetical protein